MAGTRDGEAFVRLEFLGAYARDADAGEPKTLRTYQRQWPGYEDVVRRAYESVAGERAAAAGQPHDDGPSKGASVLDERTASMATKVLVAGQVALDPNSET